MSEAQQGFFSRLFKFVKTYLTKETIKKAASFLLTKIGVKAGGAYLWIATEGLNKLWKKFGNPFFTKLTYKLDRKKIDDANIKELDKNETDGAASDEKVEDELDFLNGNNPKP